MNFDMIVALYRNCKKQSLRILHSNNFTDTESLIINRIATDTGCSQDDVAVSLHLDKTTVAKAVKKLEEKKLICRLQNNDDHRKKELEVTEEGKARAAEMMLQMQNWFETLFTCLTPEEQQQFEAYCYRLQDMTDAMSLDDEG